MKDREMTMTERDYHQRLDDLPHPIRELRTRNIIVNKVAEAYLHGHIITLEEAMWRMVVELATSGEAQHERLINLMQRMPPTNFYTTAMP